MTLKKSRIQFKKNTTSLFLSVPCWLSIRSLQFQMLSNLSKSKLSTLINPSSRLKSAWAKSKKFKFSTEGPKKELFNTIFILHTRPNILSPNSKKKLLPSKNTTSTGKELKTFISSEIKKLPKMNSSGFTSSTIPFSKLRSIRKSSQT